MLCPKGLEKGDVLGLVCPSSPVCPEDWEKFEQAKQTIRALGFDVKESRNLRDCYGGYLAGSDRQRAEEIRQMFLDPEIDGILCVRGGYGAGRVVEYLDLPAIQRHPKVFIGYSDVTALHLLLNQRCNFLTFHGPMALSDMADGLDLYSRNSFLTAIHAPSEYGYQETEEKKLGILKQGKGEGILTGGNLSVIAASLGTWYEIDTRGKILFLEEVGEDAGRLDRYIFHLRNAGKFQTASGILLGQFTGCINGKDPDYDYLQCFLDGLRGYDVPVMYQIQSGHGKSTFTLPLGGRCVMDTEKRQIEFSLWRQEKAPNP